MKEDWPWIVTRRQFLIGLGVVFMPLKPPKRQRRPASRFLLLL